MQDSDFTSEFKIEADDMLNDAEDALLGIEKSNDLSTTYNIIFRCFHSVKGGAGMFQMTELTNYMHQVETLFSHFKDEPQKIKSAVVDYFLEIIDNIRVLVSGETISEDQILSYDALMNISKAKGESTTSENATNASKKEIISKRIDRSKKGIIFVVDDEEMILGVVKESLEDEGFEVHCFQSAADTISKLKQITPDLIVADYKMPETNGLEMMREIFRIDPHIPFIFLSAFITKETMQQAMRHGVFNFLDKPIDEQILISTVKSAISKRKAMELAYKSINHILYHYDELKGFLLAKNKKLLADDLKRNVENLLEQKVIIKSLIKKNY